MPLERLQKVLAHAGVASRRACETLIQEGRVAVNGVVVTELGTKVDLEQDQILVDGEPLRLREPHRYLLLHKPAGYLSVMEDERGRPDLSDLVTSAERLFPVGRLDLASEGLILLTNDGDLANRLTHPRYEHPRTYLVLVRGQPTASVLWDLRRGVRLEDEQTAPARVEVVSGWPRELTGDWWQEGMPARQMPTTWLRITLREGKKRQLRRMLSAVGYPVLRLVRIGLGPLRLGRLPPGQSRPLTPYELRMLRQPVQAHTASAVATRSDQRPLNRPSRRPSPERRKVQTHKGQRR